MHKLKYVAAATLLVSLMAGCANGNQESSKDSSEKIPAESMTKDPITLKVYKYSSALSDDEFKKLIAEPITKKYPNITMQLVASGKGTSPEELVAAGDFPDLIFDAYSMIPYFNELNLLEDLNPYIKKHNFGLSVFEPYAIEAIKTKADKGQFYSIPFSENVTALFYNKDIFDKLNVSYPKEAMTWTEAAALARQIGARASEGTMGLSAGNIIQFSQSLEIPMIDTKTQKATLTIPNWKKAFDTYKSLYEIPGSNLIPDNNAENDMFYKGNLAMVVAVGARFFGGLETLYKTGASLNYEIASTPVFEDAPGKRRTADIQSLMISATSKHKEAAFQAIMTLYNKEHQLLMTRNGRLTVYKDSELKKQYAADLKSVAGKNVSAIFKTQPALPAPYSKYEGIAGKYIGEAAKKVINDKVDVNTALREAEELANKDIQAEKNK